MRYAWLWVLCLVACNDVDTGDDTGGGGGDTDTEELECEATHPEFGTWYADCDGDGYAGDAAFDWCGTPVPGDAIAGVCADAKGFVAFPSAFDCDDADATVQSESPWYADCDGDGRDGEAPTASCGEPVEASVCGGVAPSGGWSADPPTAPDCDDLDPSAQEPVSWWPDCDGDLFFSGAPTSSCGQPDEKPCDGGEPFSWTDAPGDPDCDDRDPDAQVEGTWYPDCDGDGVATTGAVAACGLPEAELSTSKVCAGDRPPLAWTDDPPLDASDCDDEDPSASTIDAWHADCDGDGRTGESHVACGLPSALCADGAPPVWLDAATEPDCDDEDADTTDLSDFHADCDGDGATADGVSACGVPDAICDWLPSASLIPDCDDANPAASVEADWFADCDGDGEPGGFSSSSCGPPAETALASCADLAPPDGAWSATGGADCDDDDALAKVETTLYPDCDRDGVPAIVKVCGPVAVACGNGSPPFSYAPEAPDVEDCDDEDPAVAPGNVDAPGDGVDGDCAGGDPPFDGWFVSAATGSSSGAGTKDDPFDDLPAALAKADGKPIFLARGSYAGAIGGLSGDLFGGYDESDWSRDPGLNYTTVALPGALAVLPTAEPAIAGVELTAPFRGLEVSSALVLEDVVIAAGEVALFVTGGDVTVRRSRLSSETTSALLVGGGSVVVEQTDLQAYSGAALDAQSAAALVVRKSTLTGLTGAVISSGALLEEVAIQAENFGVRAYGDGSGRIERCTIDVASSGAPPVGIWISHDPGSERLLVRNNALRVEVPGPATGIEVFQGRVDAVGNFVWAAMANVSSYAVAAGTAGPADVVLVNNTLVARFGADTAAIRALAPARLVAVNNVLDGSMGSQAVAIRYEAGAELTLHDNRMPPTAPCVLMRGFYEVCVADEAALDGCGWDAACVASSGNTVGDPGLVDASQGSFELTSTSACIDAGGDPAEWVGDDADVDRHGDPRGKDGGWDIGADEYVPAGPGGT